jgi:hypothetical protein
MTFLKATPRTLYKGIRDLSIRTPIPVPVEIPTHLPHVYLLTERGDTLPHICIGSGFNQMYGIDSLDPLSPFATHATMGARQAMANGNMCMIQRVLPPNAKRALLRFSLELIPVRTLNKERSSDGLYTNAATDFIPNTEEIDIDGTLYTDDVGQGVAFPSVYVKSAFRAIWHVGVAGYVGAMLDGSWQLDGSGNLGAQPNGAVDRKLFAQGNVVTSFRSGDALGIDGSPLNGENIFIGPDGDGGATNVVVEMLNGVAPAASILYPIFDLEVSTEGSFGDLNGIMFHAPNAFNDQGGDSATMEIINAYLYRMTMVRREKDSTTPLLIETLGGDSSVDFTLKQNVLHPRTKQPLNISRSVLPPYENLKDRSITPIHGPFGRVHAYESNINTVLALLIEGDQYVDLPTQWSNLSHALPGESVYNPYMGGYGRTEPFYFSPTNGKVNHLLNFFTGVDQNNVPFAVLDAESSTNYGGVALGNNAVHYADGGSDGLYYDAYGQPDRLRNLEMFDTLVRTQLRNYGSLEAKVLDEARYPLSAIWDTGFSLPTKHAMLTPLSLRKDLWVALATQAVADYSNPDVPLANQFAWRLPNTGAEESSLAMLLSERAAVYPESELYGTSVCRAIIVGRTDELLNTSYQGILPYTIDVLDKVAKYMGAGDGVWKSTFNFSSWPNNTVTEFADANITYRSPTAYDKDWDNGLIWVQYFDSRSLYYPAFQTVYKNDTSVLNSFFTMAGCVELTKICARVIRELQGDDSLTEAQFIQKSDRRINELATAAKFDNRFVIRPTTYKTAADNAYGFSWSVRADLYANNMQTVGQLTIVVHRRDELDAAA